MNKYGSFRKTPLAIAVGAVVSATMLGISPLALAEEQLAQEKQLVEEFTVVGSRIKRDGFSNSSPIDVLSAEDAITHGYTSVGALLQNTTIAVGSPQVNAASSSEFVQNGGVGTNTISLRGLGANRTLVLLNGRRIGPAGTRGGVSSFDLGVLPLSAIDRVEILKDGASSIYGSDAVAGVINIITKKTDGGTLDAFIAQPGHSGGEQARLSASFGKTFERGNFRVTADYSKQTELDRGNRSYFNCGEQYVFSPPSGARRDTVDPRTGKPHCADPNGGIWGHVWVYDYQGPGGNVPAGTKLQYDYDGDLANYVPPLEVDAGNPDFMVAPEGWFPVDYDRETDAVTNFQHPLYLDTSLIPETETYTLLGEGEFNLTDNTTAYAEVLLNRRKTSQDAYRQYWSYIYNGNYNAFAGEFGGGNSQSVGWTGAQWLSPTPITDHADTDIEVDYGRFVAGLRGEFADDWSWDTSFQYSNSSGDYIDDQVYDDSIGDQNFLSGSCTGSTTSVRGVSCVDIPWLDPALLAGDVSPEVQAFLFGTEKGNTEYEQWSVEAVVTGGLFDVPAGTVAGAFGLQYREDSINDVPGDITLSNNAWNTITAGITKGDDNTKSVFAEVDIPLLNDRPGFESLVLNGSARYTDVDSYGSDVTYKAGIDWQIIPQVRLRASQGTSFRTPALFELYLKDQTSSLAQSRIDPCIRWGTALDSGDINQRTADNCASEGIADDFVGAAISANIITGGGFGVLEAETSKSRTIGLIYQPETINLSISVDYFDIKVKDEVDQIGAEDILKGCYNSTNFSTEPLCDLFDRSGVGGGVDNVNDSFINIAEQKNRGLDFAAKFETELPWGNLLIEAQTTYQIEDKVNLFLDPDDPPVNENGELGNPKWAGTIAATLTRGDWSYFWAANYIGSADNYGEDAFNGNTATLRGETVEVVLEADAIWYHAFSVTREFEDAGVRVLLGVANAFDQHPPTVTTLNLGEIETQGNSAFYSQYDWIGRRFFLNLTKTF